MPLKKTNFDYKKNISLDRKAIDSQIKNLEKIVDISINVFSSVWANMFKNQQIKSSMTVRCNTVLNRNYFEDVVRAVFLLKNNSNSYTPFFKSYFTFLLDYNNEKNIFFKGKIEFFSFAILNKEWFWDKWVDHIKVQRDYSILKNNAEIDVLSNRNHIIKKRLKIKSTNESDKRQKRKLPQKIYDDNYLIVKNLLTRFNINIQSLAELIGYPQIELERFVAGRRNGFLKIKLCDIYHINNLSKKLTISELSGIKFKELDDQFGGIKTESLVDVVIRLYAIEYCEQMRCDSFFGFHVKRFNKPGNRKNFKLLVLYFLWLCKDYENDIKKIIIDYFNMIIKNWRNQKLSDFKTLYFILDCFFFDWEKQIFLSRSAGSYFIGNKKAETIVFNDKVLVNNSFGKINLKNLRRIDNKANGIIKIENRTQNAIFKKREIDIGLYSDFEILLFKKMSKSEIEAVMDKQSQEITDKHDVDQKRFEQLLKIYEKF